MSVLLKAYKACYMHVRPAESASACSVCDPSLVSRDRHLDAVT